MNIQDIIFGELALLDSLPEKSLIFLNLGKLHEGRFACGHILLEPLQKGRFHALVF